MGRKGDTQTETRKEGTRMGDLVIPVVPSICEKGNAYESEVENKNSQKELERKRYLQLYSSSRRR